ncbi:hypothetical protein SAMN05660909_01870 [Chitinophaga terrae (ex Kim and Jung 2007)]|jgi:hypothetical protein|uniref:Uncharacterized protein n=1 Tax=Chitinophaga terrae (ex Kim and Jung 2007) TaxID=408074 RepID=A0A1H4B3Y2_9BACT|nr:hypothetical protein [Chitinophaga terrae (ex Kim and Jung 2007)]MDQ0106394.1 uncharacterized membrane-anchored protein YhcB (DUF1043 family) [Chitinophaga terrae (ex Kim and Jung 2007)]SEA42893.1 hypothetical protein SAMN05660909_01870 [Chitinophaga terrae (ex Kim and Jung 2007)]
MSKRHQQNRPRLKIAAGLCIVIGLLLGITIKRVQVGLVIGIALGLLTSGMWTKSNSRD